MSAYVDFGYGKEFDEQISRDGELLAGIATFEEVQADESGVEERFLAAGGSDSHSGYSWGCVKSVAALLLKHGWKTVEDIPAGDPLSERVVREVVTAE